MRIKHLQIFFLLMIILFSSIVSGCLSDSESEVREEIEIEHVDVAGADLNSITMKPFQSGSALESYLNIVNDPLYWQDEKFYQLRYSGRTWPQSENKWIYGEFDYQIISEGEERTENVTIPRIYSETNIQIVSEFEPQTVAVKNSSIIYVPENFYPSNIHLNMDWNIGGDYYGYDLEQQTFIVNYSPLSQASVTSDIAPGGAFHLVGDILIQTQYNSISAYDISNPANPVQIWSKELYGYYAGSVLKDDKLYVAVYNNSISYPVRYMWEELNYSQYYYPTSFDIIQPVTDTTYFISEVDIKTGNFSQTLAFAGTKENGLYISENNFYIVHHYQANKDVLYLNFIKEYGSSYLSKDVMKEINQSLNKNYSLPSATRSEIESIVYRYFASIGQGLDDDYLHRETLAFQYLDGKYVYEVMYTENDAAVSLTQLNLDTFNVKTNAIAGRVDDISFVHEVNDSVYVVVTNFGSYEYSKKSNSLYIFNEDLELLGSVSGLITDDLHGVNENGRISKVYFDNNKVFVNLRADDYLSISDDQAIMNFEALSVSFLVDTTDSSNPTVLGKYSENGELMYMKLVNDTTAAVLLKVGDAYEIDMPGISWDPDDVSMKLSLISFEDPANTKTIDKYVFDKSEYSSENHSNHQFTWIENQELIVIPTYEHAFIFAASNGSLSLLADDVHKESMVSQVLQTDNYLCIFSDSSIHFWNTKLWRNDKTVDIPQPLFPVYYGPINGPMYTTPF